RGERASMEPPRERGGNQTRAPPGAAAGAVASMEPPRERGGNSHGESTYDPGRVASMEPPRERGGNARPIWSPCWLLDSASMEPPRERGGNYGAGKVSAFDVALQWSRRVNAAETPCP